MFPALAMAVPVSKVAGVSAGSLYTAAFTGAVSGVVVVALVVGLGMLIAKGAKLAKKILDADPKK